MSQAESAQQHNRQDISQICPAMKSKSMANGVKIFGDHWTLFIISTLSQGEKRFCELQRNLNDINPVTLTNRLKKLEKLGFIKRREETIDKLSVTYELTKKGEGMVAVIQTIETYAKKYL